MMSLATTKTIAWSIAVLGVVTVLGTQVQSSAAKGDGTPIVIASGFETAASPTATVVALAAEGEGERRGPRDGERPAAPGEGAPRDEAAAKKPRDGERPSTGALRKEAPIKKAPREGERPDSAAEGEGGMKDPLAGFVPQTQREKMLLGIIIGMRREMAEMQKLLQSGDGAGKPGVRDVEGERKGPRDGEGVKKPGVRDGEGERKGPRDGEGVKKPGVRDGEGERKGPRDNS